MCIFHAASHSQLTFPQFQPFRIWCGECNKHRTLCWNRWSSGEGQITTDILQTVWNGSWKIEVSIFFLPIVSWMETHIVDRSCMMNNSLMSLINSDHSPTRQTHNHPPFPIHRKNQCDHHQAISGDPLEHTPSTLCHIAAQNFTTAPLTQREPTVRKITIKTEAKSNKLKSYILPIVYMRNVWPASTYRRDLGASFRFHLPFERTKVKSSFPSRFAAQTVQFFNSSLIDRKIKQQHIFCRAKNYFVCFGCLNGWPIFRLYFQNQKHSRKIDFFRLDKHFWCQFLTCDLNELYVFL